MLTNHSYRDMSPEARCEDLTITANGKVFDNVKRLDGSDATNLIKFLHHLQGRSTLKHVLFKVDGNTAYIL